MDGQNNRLGYCHYQREFLDTSFKGYQPKPFHQAGCICDPEQNRVKISLFTPSHDPSFLDETYRSIKEQSFTAWEWLILLNNGAEYRNDDPRVEVVKDDTGIRDVGYLKRTACRQSSGDVLVEMDHDELLLP